MFIRTFFGGSGDCSDVGVEGVDRERGFDSLTGGNLVSFSGAGGGAGAAFDLGGGLAEGGLDDDEERRWKGGADCLDPRGFGGS